MVIVTTNQVSRDQPNWIRPQWTLDIVHFWRPPHYNSIIQIFKQIFIVWTQVEVCRTNCFLFTLTLFTPKIMWKSELPEKSEVRFLIHFPCLKPRCRVCTALCTSHNWDSPPPLPISSTTSNLLHLLAMRMYLSGLRHLNFSFVLTFVVVFVSELHPLCRGYEKLFKASLWETKVGSIKFIPLEKMYHRSNRASIGKTSKWHHRMSWLFLYIGHKRTQLCLICDTGSDYMVTTTTEGRAITSSCGALPTRSWSTKMVMFRPPPCPPWWCRPWWPSSHPRVDHNVR